MGADLIGRHAATKLRFHPIADDDIDTIDFDAYFDDASFASIG